MKGQSQKKAHKLCDKESASSQPLMLGCIISISRHTLIVSVDCRNDRDNIWGKHLDGHLIQVMLETRHST